MPPLGSQLRLRLEALALDRPRARRAAALAGVSYVAWRLLPRLRRLYRATVDWRDPVLPRDLRALRVPLAAADVEDEIREKRAVVDGAAREVAWATPGRRTRTALAVVYVHGWGACRQEIAPTPQLLAKALGANLYCHRLSGHGRRRAAAPPTDPPSGDILLAEATPRRLFLDALEAFRVGLALGDRVVVVGVSTGGGLATWLAARVADRVESSTRLQRARCKPGASAVRRKCDESTQLDESERLVQESAESASIRPSSRGAEVRRSPVAFRPRSPTSPRATASRRSCW